MPQAVFLSDDHLGKLQRLIKDKQKRRLNEYVCSSCEGKMSIATVWTCLSCDTMQNTSGKYFDPYILFRTIYHMFALPRTPLSGCSDRYCDNPNLGAIRCPHCETDLVFDQAAYQSDPKAVARVTRPIGVEEMLSHLAVVADAAAEEEHQQEMDRVRREEELNRARADARNSQQDDDDEPDWVKKPFRDAGID